MNKKYDIASFADIERFYGGQRGMMQRFGLSQPGIACWKIRGIPTGYHLRIYLEARMLGLTIDPALFDLPPPLADYIARDSNRSWPVAAQ